MTDYPEALAAAREAHTYVKHRGMTRAEAALGDLLAALDAARGEAVADGEKLWLWRHRDHFLAFKHEYPCFTPGGDPMTLGPPSGYALFQVSHDRGCAAPPAALAVPAGWREHVEDRIRTWRQSFVNRHGDQLEILDFMGSDSLDDLIDYVCSGQVQPAALAVPEAAALVQKWREQANAALRRSGTWNGNDMADRIERMADELAAMLAAAERKGE